MGKTEDFSRLPHGVATSSPLSHPAHQADRSNGITGWGANAALAVRGTGTQCTAPSAGVSRTARAQGAGAGRAEATARADPTGARCCRLCPRVSSVSPEEGRLPSPAMEKLPLPLLLAMTSQRVSASQEPLCPACLSICSRASCWQVLGKGQLGRTRSRSLQTPRAVESREPEGRTG